MSLTLELFLNGNMCRLSMLKRPNRCEAGEFIQKYKKDDARYYKKLFALLERIAEHGPLRHNETQFKRIRPNLYEIKSSQARLFCFYEEDRHLVITHGALKKGNTRVQDQEIDKAEKLRDEFLNQ